MSDVATLGFGPLLRQFRLRTGLSQEELGARARLSAETIGALERGARRAPYRATVDLLAQGLALTPSERTELEATAAAARARTRGPTVKPAAPVGNLPAPVTSFIGREDEIRDICDLLGRHRLVTITGTGGIGKTRTSLEVGAVVAESFPDGTWFVDLAVLEAGAMIEARITSALGVREQDAGNRSALVGELRTRSALLVLDNCEHVLESVASTVAALLRECSELKILATSRERLALSGEVVFRMQNLAVPPAHAHLCAGDARSYSAIELFTDRAAIANHRFALRDDDVAFVVSICRRLEGLALAIEIAAARSPIGLPALDEMIGLNATSVSSGLRDASPRHQTLAATIAWSYGLLTEHQQHILRELSVFTGSFTIEAAGAVCSFDGADHAELPLVLAALCEKSLLNSESETGKPRFTLLQSIRDFAHRELVAHGEATAAAARHGEYYGALADYVRANPNGFTRDRLFHDVRGEIDNINAALERNLQPNGEALVAARITVGLTSYWQISGRVRESMQNALILIERIDGDAHPALVASLFLVREYGLVGMDRVNVILRAIDLAVGIRDARLLRDAFSRLGDAYRLLKLPSKAHTAFGWAWTYAGIARSGPDRLAIVLFGRGLVERLEGRFEDARSSLNAALALVTSVDEVSVAVHIRNALAEIEFELGNARGALAIAEGLVAAMESHGTQFPYLCNTCAYRIVLGEIAEAKRVARHLLDRVHGSHPTYVIVILEHVSTIAAVEGRSDTAARLRGYTEESGRRIGYVREQTEERCYAIGTSALRERCSDEELHVWTAQGARLSEQRAIALALTEGLSCSTAFAYSNPMP